ncbi:hypothetical protein BD408DRAFT_417432 [Parasitella parasitica]|nr:hypothetical protein BD408DRAFT_417432 [Parasitella parasitica]
MINDCAYCFDFFMRATKHFKYVILVAPFLCRHQKKIPQRFKINFICIMSDTYILRIFGYLNLIFLEKFLFQLIVQSNLGF